ncbi:hypothetical protein Pla144_37840 [Bythopirellula polymerisocia]|uniref:Uncharacterized protein n=1 Tax=Bythopirellula polymerisocia TaxID=2528003 RepID=A0A5C6CLA4_9BACT|nr:hypothetical protein Pla144_37840 [Bythopirellula polymerisocia]
MGVRYRKHTELPVYQPGFSLAGNGLQFVVECEYFERDSVYEI